MASCLISIFIDFTKTVSDHELYSIIEDTLYPHPDQTNLDINPTGNYLYEYHIINTCQLFLSQMREIFVSS